MRHPRAKLRAGDEPIAVPVELPEPHGHVRVSDVVIRHRDGHGDERRPELVGVHLAVTVGVELVKETVQRGGVNVPVDEDTAHGEPDVVRQGATVPLRASKPRGGHLSALKLGVEHLEGAVPGEKEERGDAADEVQSGIVRVAEEGGNLHDEEEQAGDHHDFRVESGVLVGGDAGHAEAGVGTVGEGLGDGFSGEGVEVATADPQGTAPSDGEKHHRASGEGTHADGHLFLRRLLGGAETGRHDDRGVGDGAEDGKEESSDQSRGENLEEEFAPIRDELRRL